MTSMLDAFNRELVSRVTSSYVEELQKLTLPVPENLLEVRSVPCSANWGCRLCILQSLGCECNVGQPDLRQVGTVHQVRLMARRHTRTLFV